MKRLFLIPLVIIMLAGCIIGGKEIKVDDPATRGLLAWGAGQMLGFAINTLTPKSDEALGIAWTEFMRDHKDDELVQPRDVIMFHDFCVSIIAVDYGDAWGIVSDLRFLFTNYGANLSVDGKKILEIDPVPYADFLAFQQGYESGKLKAQMALKED